MKKQFLALVLCLSVVMTNNTYSMNDSSEEIEYNALVKRKPLEKDLSAVRTVPYYRWSDLNPYNWSAATKWRAAKGALIFTYASMMVYRVADIMTTHHPKQCNPEMNYNMECNDNNCSIVSSRDSANEQLQLILNDTIRNVTHTICQYWGKTSCCEFPVDLVYDKESLLRVIFKSKYH